MRVLLAYDGSEHADRAARDLGNAGLPHDAEIHIVTVADVIAMPDLAELHGSRTPERGIIIRSQASTAVQRAVEEAAKIGLHGAALIKGLHPSYRVRVDTLMGTAAWTVVQQAERLGAELLVVGSHGRTPLARLLLGSVSDPIVQYAPCGVRVVHTRVPSPGAPLRILVAVDGSADAEAAVRAAAARHWPLGTRMEIINVINGSTPSVAVHAAAILATRDLRVEVLELAGNPHRLILHEAQHWEADCIFLGARGRHRTRPGLGTTASTVASNAHCSVEIVRGPTGS